jgi:PAS domain S-box-containing protein
MTERDILGAGPQASAAQLWAVLDEIPARVSFIDRDRRHAYVNREYAAFVGRPAAEILGRTIAEVYGEAEDARLRPFAEAALEGETVRWQGWVKSPGDADRFIERVYKPHHDGAGRIMGYFVLVRDTTEHRRAEREQRRLHQILRDAVESLPNAFVVYGPDHRVTLCNAAFAETLDADPAELEGLSPQETLRLSGRHIKSFDGRPVESLDDWVEHVMARFDLANREPVELEMDDGRAMLLSIHPTSDGGRVAIRTEISALKRMQEALRESEAVARNVLGACPVPIGMTRAEDGTIIYESPASERLFGRDPSTPGGVSAADYYVDQADRARYLGLLREHGAVDGFEVQMMKADGTRFWASISARRLDYQGEEVIVSSTQDLTERREFEAQMARQREALYQSEKLNALGGLLAGVAHELNNPLSVVLGQAQLLGETSRDPETKTRAERIGGAADRCSRIVKTFLAMARQTTPERRQVDLNEVVASALEITGYALRSADIEVTCNCAEKLPAVWADSDQLSQVVMNLIINAEQAMADQVAGRKLRIDTGTDAASQAVRLTVRDSGPGITPEVRSRIFDPFFTTKEVGVGTGVGLTVSLGIVQAHDGTLQVDSEPGRGAAFTVSLPYSRGRGVEVEPLAAPERRRSVAPGKVLIVDDEPEVSETLADIVSLDGHEVETANSGHLALRALAHRDFDAILCDMRMPDVDGRGLYARIKQAYPELVERIVFVTGDALGPSIRSFLDETGLPCLEKPLAADEVLETVGRVIGQAARAGASGQRRE